MKQHQKGILAVLFACAILSSGCDSTYIKETVSSAPRITSFSPESGSVGSEIVITGEYLDDVVSATIGGQTVTVQQRVSNQRLSLKVTSNAVSGKIALANSVGEGVSEADFTLVYPTPVISDIGLPDEVEMGGRVLISGSYLNVVNSVLFVASGNTTGNAATLLSQSESEILLTVPFVESSEASIVMTYSNGTEIVETSLDSAPKVAVVRNEPSVTTTTFESAREGETVTLEGSNLDKIEEVLVADIVCAISSQSETSLSFTVPSSDDFVDGNNTVSLKISYFSGTEVVTLTDAFVVYVSSVYFWENRTVYAQGSGVAEFSSFFSPETGIVYSNSVWSTIVDPIAFAKMGSTDITEDEYNSVNPYFFFYANGSNKLCLYNPSGSATILKNYVDSSGARILGSNSASCYGTPKLTFLYLSNRTGHEELKNMVINGTLETIDEETFPIDTEAKTCGGISLASGINSGNNSTWADGFFTAGTNAYNVKVDAVFLIFYYNYKGYSSSNYGENIKRIGLLHIKTVDFLMDGEKPSNSAVTFDIYWQKHDYDYSLVPQE